MGIRQAGIPIGGVLAGVLIPLLVIKYNLSYAIHVIGSICIIGGLLFSIFYRDSCVRKEGKEERIKTSFWVQLKSVMHKKSVVSNLYNWYLHDFITNGVSWTFYKFFSNGTINYTYFSRESIFSYVLFWNDWSYYIGSC
ncbi:MFS transporter [Bacillus toyonensis]